MLTLDNCFALLEKFASQDAKLQEVKEDNLLDHHGYQSPVLVMADTSYRSCLTDCSNFTPISQNLEILLKQAVQTLNTNL